MQQLPQSKFYSFTDLLKNPVFIISWFIIAGVSFGYFDKPMAYFFHSLDMPVLHSTAAYVSMIGIGGTYIAGFGILYILTRWFSKNADLIHNSFFMFLCAAAPGLIGTPLKVIFGRSRPSLLFENQDYGFYFWQKHANMWSFPSGHTFEITAVMMGLSFLFPRYWFGFISVAILVGISRLILSAHFLSDVMVGMYLGAITAVLLQEILRRYRAALLTINRVNAL